MQPHQPLFQPSPWKTILPFSISKGDSVLLIRMSMESLLDLLDPGLGDERDVPVEVEVAHGDAGTVLEGERLHPPVIDELAAVAFDSQALDALEHDRAGLRVVVGGVGLEVFDLIAVFRAEVIAALGKHQGGRRFLAAGLDRRAHALDRILAAVGLDAEIGDVDDLAGGGRGGVACGLLVAQEGDAVGRDHERVLVAGGQRFAGPEILEDKLGGGVQAEFLQAEFDVSGVFPVAVEDAEPAVVGVAAFGGFPNVDHAVAVGEPADDGVGVAGEDAGMGEEAHREFVHVVEDAAEHQRRGGQRALDHEGALLVRGEIALPAAVAR